MSRHDHPSGVGLASARLVLIAFTVLALGVVALEIARSDVSTTFEPRARRPAAVVTDGRRILEIEARTGRVVATLLALPTTDREHILALAPRPGALTGLPMMVLSGDHDGPLLWWLDDAGRRRALPGTLARPQTSVSSALAVQAVPVWSPDGSHVAWLEGTHGAATLRVVAWSADGPRAADDRHTRSELSGELGPGARLEAWRWKIPGPEATGALLISEDRPGLYELTVRRESGRVVTVGGRPDRLPGPVIDRADATRVADAPHRARYHLVLPLERGGPPLLRWSTAAGSSGTLPLPQDMGGIRTRWWIDAYGPLVLVGDGEAAWALQPHGNAVLVPGRIIHGAVLERRVDQDDGAFLPTPGRAR